MVKMDIGTKVEFTKHYYLNDRRQASDGDRGIITATAGVVTQHAIDVRYCDVKLEGKKKPLEAVPVGYLREIK